MADTPRYNRTGRQHTAFAGLRASGMTVVFDNMMDGTACVTGNAPWRWDDVVTDLGMRQADLAHQSDVVVVRTRRRHRRAPTRDGPGGAGLRARGGHPDRATSSTSSTSSTASGIRQIGIAYSDANALGQRAGRGRRRRADRARPPGRAADEPARAGDRRLALLRPAPASRRVPRRSDRPVFMTHAGARAVWDIPRLKRDDVLRAVADTGGVIGMSAAPHTTLSARPSPAQHRCR